jgi:hypothetical protein
VLSYRGDALAEVRAKIAKVAKGGDGIHVRRGERLLEGAALSAPTLARGKVWALTEQRPPGVGRLRRWLRVMRFLKEGVLA